MGILRSLPSEQFSGRNFLQAQLNRYWEMRAVVAKSTVETTEKRPMGSRGLTHLPSHHFLEGKADEFLGVEAGSRGLFFQLPQQATAEAETDYLILNAENAASP